MKSDIINGVFKQIRLSWDVAMCGKLRGGPPIFRIRQSEKAGLLGSEGGDITPPYNFSRTIYQLTRCNIKEILNFEICKFFDQTSSYSAVAETYSVSDSVLEYSLEPSGGILLYWSMWTCFWLLCVLDRASSRYLNKGRPT